MADPMDHADDNWNWSNPGIDDGPGGTGNMSESSSSVVYGKDDFAGFNFSGNAAEQIFSAFLNSYNRDESGDWDFSVGLNNNGKIGYWGAYDAGKGQTYSDGRMQQILVATKFYTFDNDNSGGDFIGVRQYLVGNYKWFGNSGFGMNGKYAAIEGLFLEMIPDDPRTGDIPILIKYSQPVTVAINKFTSEQDASKKFNNVWNLAVQQVTATVNAGKTYPFINFVQRDFERFLMSDARTAGIQVFLNSVPIGVSFDDQHISNAKFSPNLYQ